MKCKERVKMEIQLWRSILCPYELAVRELEVKFNHIIDECKENDVYCPIEQVEGRVKSVSSILEKMQRKHIPMERMEEELEDIAGVRIIFSASSVFTNISTPYIPNPGAPCIATFAPASWEKASISLCFNISTSCSVSTIFCAL